MSQDDDPDAVCVNYRAKVCWRYPQLSAINTSAPKSRRRVAPMEGERSRDLGFIPDKDLPLPSIVRDCWMGSGVRDRGQRCGSCSAGGGRRGIEQLQLALQQHCWRGVLLGFVVRLAVPLVLEFGRLGVERQGLLQGPVVYRQLDDGPAHCVPAHDVAVLEEVVEQRPGLDGRWEREGHDCHSGRSGIGRVEILNLDVGC